MRRPFSRRRGSEKPSLVAGKPSLVVRQPDMLRTGLPTTNDTPRANPLASRRVRERLTTVFGFAANDGFQVIENIPKLLKFPCKLLKLCNTPLKTSLYGRDSRG